MGRTSTEEGSPLACRLGEKFSDACLQPSGRIEVPELSLSERLKSLTAEETGTVDLGTVQAEANRCFNCGCVAVSPSDLAPALIALGARVKTSERLIEAEEFFSVGIDTSTVLADGEMVLEIQVPRPATGSRSAFLKCALRKSIDFPLVNCAASITSEKNVVKEARICLNSVYGVPHRVSAAERSMIGKPIDEATATEAAEAGLAGALPLPSNRYKVQIARALVKRAILACASGSKAD
jgi:CO/xanthine dehydrogenase FAD-binding subunit